jgi:eukaryotic-like serine/threonine-protein kinase
MPSSRPNDEQSPVAKVKRIAFDRFQVDLRSGELLCNGHRIRLQAQPFQILSLLLARPGEVVTREEIRRKLWDGDTFVDFDHSLGTAINKVREALGDSAENPRFVETLPKRGYRFVFPVTPATGREMDGPAETGLRSPSGWESESEVARDDAHAGSKIRRSGWIWSSAAILMIMAIGAGAFWFYGRTPKLIDKHKIVLADFTNTTGDPVFDGTLRQGLSIQLEQSPFLSILSDQQIQQTLHMMGLKPDATLTPGITREVCQRTSSAAVVDGTIAQIGGRYLLTLKTVACSDGELIASTEEQASDKNHILDALGDAASGIRNKLGESLATIQKFNAPLQQVTTSSLEALRAFSLSVSGAKPGVDSGLPFLQRAIELDPNFAFAYVQLSDAYSAIGETELASEYAQKAFDNRGHASERERLQIAVTYYSATLGDLDRELSIYPVWEQMYPRDAGPWVDSSDTRNSLGDYDRALAEAQEGLRLASNSYVPYLNAGSALLSLNKRDEAKQIAQRALAQDLDVPAVRLLLYRVAFLENNTKEMEAQLAPLLGTSGSGSALALFAQSATDAYFGRLGSSLGFSSRGVEVARRANFNELAAQARVADALREAEFGNPAQARKAAATALTLSSGRKAKLLTALALARAGDTMRAKTLADELNRQFRSDTLLQKYWLPTIRGSIELARKNPSRAIDALQGVSYELGDTGFLVGNLYPAYLRGQAYLGTRQGKGAAAEFQKLLDHRSIVVNSPLGALAYLGLARAYSLQGNISKAREAYQDFLALWKDADPDIPILKQAKAEYAKLK